MNNNPATRLNDTVKHLCVVWMCHVTCKTQPVKQVPLDILVLKYACFLSGLREAQEIHLEMRSVFFYVVILYLKEVISSEIAQNCTIKMCN